MNTGWRGETPKEDPRRREPAGSKAERQSFLDSEAWKWIRVGLELLAVAAFIYIMIILIGSCGVPAHADAVVREAWVVCQPGDYVNARSRPSGRSEVLGRFDPGDVVMLDGKKRNGFMHVINAGLEEDECWIHEGYLVYDPPEYLGGETGTVASNGRLAARKRIGGDRRLWLNNGDAVRIWYRSDDWCVTDKGFVKTEFIDWK